MGTCVAFSIKFAKTNQKFAENSEFCENYSLLFKIIHWCPYLGVEQVQLVRDEEANLLHGLARLPPPGEQVPLLRRRDGDVARLEDVRVHGGVARELADLG